MSPVDVLYVQETLVATAFFSGLAGGVVGLAAFYACRAVGSRVLRSLGWR